MTVADDLDALMAAVAGDGPSVSEAAAAPSFTSADVNHTDDGTIDFVQLTLAAAVPLSELEARFGASSPLPTPPTGGNRRLQFPDTIADDGVGATLLAEVDDGRVVAVTVRRDDMSA